MDELVPYLKRHMTLEQAVSLLKDGVPLTGSWGLRRWVAERDLEAFAKLYFPEEFTLDLAPIHREFCRDGEELRRRALAGLPGLKLARAIPRGHSKSTYYSRLVPIHGFLYGWSPLTVLIGNNFTAGERLTKNIRDELDTNERILEDFEPRGPVWQTNHLQGANGATIRSFGVGSGAIRGVSRPGRRPSLVIGDDLDDDASVRSPVQLAANVEWFTKAVLPLGDQVTFTTSYIVVGTIIRSTSLMSHVLSLPDFQSIVQKGVLRFADRSDLWDAWREWFIAEAKAGRKPVDPASDAFYQEHRDEMLRGTAVLWDRPDAYWHLMVYRLSSGERAFWAEIQNDPGVAGGALGPFPVWRGGSLDDPGWELIGSLDPTTRGGKGNDLAAWTECLFHRDRKEVVLTYLDAKQRPYGETIKAVADRIEYWWRKGRPFSALFCEANSAGLMVADAINEELDRRQVFQTVTKVSHSAPKDDRIGLLSHFAGLRQFYVADGVDSEFENEWNGYPSYRFDDALDSAATVCYQLKKLGLLDVLERPDTAEARREAVRRAIETWADQPAR